MVLKQKAMFFQKKAIGEGEFSLYYLGRQSVVSKKIKMGNIDVMVEVMLHKCFAK